MEYTRRAAFLGDIELKPVFVVSAEDGSYIVSLDQEEGRRLVGEPIAIKAATPWEAQRQWLDIMSQHEGVEIREVPLSPGATA